MAFQTYSCPRLNYHYSILASEKKNSVAIPRVEVLINMVDGLGLFSTNCDKFSEKKCELSSLYHDSTDFPERCILTHFRNIK